MKALPYFTVTCDGSCHPNPGGKMGVGAVIRDPAGALFAEHGAHQPARFGNHASNQVAEIMAAVAGIGLVPQGSVILVRTDSMYVINCASRLWQRKANLAYWAVLDAAVNRHRHVRWSWVKGHHGDADNERADELAEMGRRQVAILLRSQGPAQDAPAAKPNATLLLSERLLEGWGS